MCRNPCGLLMFINKPWPWHGLIRAPLYPTEALCPLCPPFTILINTMSKRIFFPKFLSCRYVEKDLRYLPTNYPILFSENLYLSGYEEDYDDGASFCSLSTNATMDDNPGPGRIIDKCIYQFLGKKIEQFANRISISCLPPHTIAQCLWVNMIHLPNDEFYPLGPIIGLIQADPNLPCEGSARIAGLKSLVKQAK